MGSFTIRKGMNIRLTGAPQATIQEIATPDVITVCPQEFSKIKPRLKIREGDRVKRGSPLFFNKRNPAWNFCSPAAGTIQSITFGPRRVLEKITIQVDKADEAEPFKRYAAAQIPTLSREDALAQLLSSGLWAYIKQRPFGNTADPAATPKSIFVNAMNTAPHQVDINVALQGHEAAFQAGLDVLTRLTKGAVHLCVDGSKNNAAALTQAKNVQIHTFQGVHPAGNSSIHIYHIDRLKPRDIVWTVKAVDVIAIGQLFIEGTFPATRIVTLGGPGVKSGACKHYRLRIGTPLQTILQNQLEAGEQRVISGDVLSGVKVNADGSLGYQDYGFTVLPEDRRRHLMGWLSPGLNVFSRSRVFLSTLFKKNAEWALTTSKHGSDRAMVLTGLYDKYMPMNIMVDYLVRAALAHDTDEAVKLGILETMPEDFALCSFVCPSKMDLVGIVRRGLEEIEKEGI